jgi:hypothetical protein
MFDGMVNVSIPNDPPKDAIPQQQTGKPAEHPGVLGHGTLPSEGGEGEMRSLVINKSVASDNRINKLVENLVLAFSPKVLEFLSLIADDDLRLSKSIVTDGVMSDQVGISQVISELAKGKPVLTISSKSLMGEVTGIDEPKKKKIVEKLKSNINSMISMLAIRHLSDVMYETELQNLDNTEMVWEDEEVVDDTLSTDYDYIMGEVKERTLSSLPMTLRAWVENEIKQE